MPVFVEDPAQFSKQRLKSELIANSVTLPDAESKKQVYVDLYLTHIGQRRAADFSSDEEDDQVMQTAGEEEEETEDPEMLDCKSLTDGELKASLLQHGVRAGPIVGSTRALYERKLEALLQPAAQPQLNGTGDTGDTGQYSDSEEDQGTSEQAGPETVSHLDQNQQDIQEPVTDVLMDIFPDTQPTPTGIVATRRRPIKGAAGRPVQFKYPDSPLSPSTRDRQKLERVLVPLWVQVVVFLIIVCLLYFIYACVGDSLDNPFGAFLENLSLKTGDVDVSLEPGDEERLLLITEPVDTHVPEPLTVQE